MRINSLIDKMSVSVSGTLQFKLSFPFSFIHKMKNETSVLIISSPAASNPSLDLINAVIDSCSLVHGLDDCPFIIVLDGYKLTPRTPHSKKGLVSQSMIDSYKLYIENLHAKYGGNPRFTIIQSPIHIGFAMAVKLGLESCATKYCLVAQHDRVFIKHFHKLPELLELMEYHQHIRYVGFPSVTNCWHEANIKYRYNMDELTSLPRLASSTSEQYQIPFCDGFWLQPLIFWYDSQHLCHVKRYLEIYTPFKKIPEHIKAHMSAKDISTLILRTGDFIEDRFGQAQRNLLCQFRSQPEVFRELFLWFGSYLLWLPDTSNTRQPSWQLMLSSVEGVSSESPPVVGVSSPTTHLYVPATPFVAHLRGRHYDEELVKRRLAVMNIPATASTSTATSVDPDDDPHCPSPVLHTVN